MDCNPKPDIKVLTELLNAAVASDPEMSVGQGPWLFRFKSETASPEFKKIDMRIQQRALEYVFLCSPKCQQWELSDVLFIGVLDLMFLSYTVYTFVACVHTLVICFSIHFWLSVSLLIILWGLQSCVVQNWKKKRREKSPKQSFLSPSFSNYKVLCCSL